MRFMPIFLTDTEGSHSHAPESGAGPDEQEMAVMGALLQGNSKDDAIGWAK